MNKNESVEKSKVGMSEDELTPYCIERIEGTNREIANGEVSPVFDDVEDAIRWLKEAKV